VPPANCYPIAASQNSRGFSHRLEQRQNIIFLAKSARRKPMQPEHPLPDTNP
jgi:hypothetical protein